jgi:hypothetical protein
MPGKISEQSKETTKAMEKRLIVWKIVQNVALQDVVDNNVEKRRVAAPVNRENRIRSHRETRRYPRPSASVPLAKTLPWKKHGITLAPL